MTYEVTTNHEEIRAWIERRNGMPAINTVEVPQRLAILFYKDENPKFEQISWDEFFDTFEQLNLAFRFELDGEEKGEFSYGFFDRNFIPARSEEDDQGADLPEEDIPIENLAPSASLYE